jgi:hypothetical protein
MQSIKFRPIAYGLLCIAGVLAVIALSVLPAGPQSALARAPQAPDAATTTEFWKLGVTSESGAAYSAVVGRAVSAVAALRSARGVTDMYYLFPAPGTTKTVQTAQVYLLSRTGAYTGTATLTLEVRDYAGVVQHTVSSGSLDFQTAAMGVWLPVSLSANAADLSLAPGEALTFHFHLDGAPAGDLDVRPLFEVQVQ